MTSKHTPGPWKFRSGQIEGPQGQLVAVMPASAIRAGKLTAAECQANMDAIEALPDLLAACEAAKIVLGNLIDSQGTVKRCAEAWDAWGIANQIAAAITKARGES